MQSDNEETIVCKVKDLKMFDTVLHSQTLGALATADNLTVKHTNEADFGKWAITFFGVGTIFVHGNITVEITPAPPDKVSRERD
jgi:hypothetical protein